ncbi:gliding motility protein GldN [Flavobacterium sp. KACC 22761]|uniref:type IX secretion system ring protein PorN/GldN n=1 Tax=Flavobacterium sp. KACC 22761 TaxID=3092665 RepID=UPI002A7660F8|nr:gliding motility protein GldN [Flavobacterium sp. KACC 22761]WPO76820.1 gliding motility protein GldN [Flavobacterium sp. KACC 22761]
MKARIILIIFLIIGSFPSWSQANLLNAKTVEEIEVNKIKQLAFDNDKPLSYGYVGERDILMGKTVWEIIDLNEKINFPLYFPVDSANIGPERRSLYDVLTKAIKQGKITEVYTDGYFNTKKTMKDIQASLSRVDTTDAGRELINQYPDDYVERVVKKKVVTGTGKKKSVSYVEEKVGPKRSVPAEYILRQDLTAQDVSQYKIKGYWFFDKRESALKYRLIGICPVTPDVYTMNSDDKDYIELFWVFFPNARDVLNEAKAFNDKNSAVPISFDQILNSRHFNALIYKEENMYGDREIKDYIKNNAQEQLFESERVKEKIRNFEEEMWSY